MTQFFCISSHSGTKRGVGWQYDDGMRAELLGRSSLHFQVHTFQEGNSGSRRIDQEKRGAISPLIYSHYYFWTQFQQVGRQYICVVVGDSKSRRGFWCLMGCNSKQNDGGMLLHRVSDLCRQDCFHVSRSKDLMDLCKVQLVHIFPTLYRCIYSNTSKKTFSTQD